MNLPDFLSQAADGEILLTGHRIGLYHIVHYYNEGCSPEMLVCQYPTLPLSLVHKVIAFYLDHQREVDAYVADCRAALDQQQDESQRLDVGALRERLHARQRAETAASSEDQ